MTEDIKPQRILHWLKRIVSLIIRWATRVGIFLVISFVISFAALHKVYPPAVEWVGEIFGFTKPSLVSALALLVVLVILDRVLALESLIANPSIIPFETRTESYDLLAAFLTERKAHKVDMLQFSGYTVLPILKLIAKSCPDAVVRLLVYNPARANEFDSDGEPDHAIRIRATVGQIVLLEKEHRIKVDISYYDTPPTISMIIVDERLVSLGWYYCYIDPKSKVLRIRGHTAPALIVKGDAAAVLSTTAIEHFNRILSASIPTDLSPFFHPGMGRVRPLKGDGP